MSRPDPAETNPDDPVALHLRSCPDCRSEQSEFRATLDLLHALPAAPEPASDLFHKILHRIDAESAPPRKRHPFHLVRHPRAQFWGKVAAGLLLTVAAALTIEQANHGGSAILARMIERRSADPSQALTRVTRTGMQWLADGPCDLLRGEGLVTQSGTTALFELPGVGTLRTNGAGQFRLTEARAMVMDAGTLYLDIEPGLGGYNITTPSGRVGVTGTRFWVRATPDWTAVLVLDGSVRLDSTSGLVDVPAFHRALARASRKPTAPEKIPVVAENRINPFAALGPDPTVELVSDAASFRVGESAAIRFRVSSESDEMWIEPYRDTSPYYLLSIQHQNDPPYTVRIGGARASAALPRQRDGEPQNIRRNEFYDVTFDLATLLRKPGNYEISGILVSAGATGAGQAPVWVGIAQSAPLPVRVTPR